VPIQGNGRGNELINQLGVMLEYLKNSADSYDHLTKHVAVVAIVFEHFLQAKDKEAILPFVEKTLSEALKALLDELDRLGEQLTKASFALRNVLGIIKSIVEKKQREQEDGFGNLTNCYHDGVSWNA